VAELELRVGEDDAALARDVAAASVDLEAPLAQATASFAPSSSTTCRT
jgi:hypothetical protein